MHILIALILAPALLYFWLIGHWFARVLAFLVFAAAFGVGGALLTSAGATYPNAGLPGLVIGGIVAWFVAGIPTYYWRHRMNLLNGVSMVRHQG